MQTVQPMQLETIPIPEGFQQVTLPSALGDDGKQYLAKTYKLDGYFQEGELVDSQWLTQQLTDRNITHVYMVFWGGYKYEPYDDIKKVWGKQLGREVWFRGMIVPEM